MGNVAIITGGAGAMGLATAKRMGADHHLLLTDVDRDRLDAAVTTLAALGITAEAVTCDITDRTAVDEVFTRAAEAGFVRAVIHTAGVSPKMGSADLIVRINALGTILVTEAAFAAAADGFAVVHVASFAGHVVPAVLTPRRAFKLATTDPDAAVARMIAGVQRGPKALRTVGAYAISKAFVIWYARQQAARFGTKGARIVSVSPGSFDTPMGRLEEGGKLLHMAAIKRSGRPEEMGAVLAFCASEAPGYLTGTDILVDGGTKAGASLRSMLTLARTSR